LFLQHFLDDVKYYCSFALLKKPSFMKLFSFKTILLFSTFCLLSFTQTGCVRKYIAEYLFDDDGGDDDNRVNSPNVPSSYSGRTVDVQGSLNVSSKNVTFKVWDSGTIDDDIISLVVNGSTVLSNYTLTGTKRSISVTLDNNGYNYVLLYAHNEGSIPPNTAALSIDDGTGEQDLVLSANLSSCGAYNIIVN
jgi:hypothetical protein